MSCDPILDRLPWFANGTLDDDERLEVEAHLDSCATCRRALDDTLALGSAASEHLPIELLLDLADGVDVSAADAELAGRHLAECRSCTAELVWARRDDELLIFPDAAAREAPRHRQFGRRSGRRLAPALVTAALLTLAIVGLLTWQRADPVVPIAVGAQLELLPETPSRATTSAPAIVVDADDSTPVALVLISDVEPPAGAKLSLDLIGPNGEVVWQQDDLARSESGLYTVILPAPTLTTGEHQIVLLASQRDTSTELARYRFRVEAPTEP